MKNSSLKYILAILPLLAACTAESFKEGEDIGLYGVISSTYETKAGVTAEAYTATVPSEEHPLNADIWFSYTSGDYSNASLRRTIDYIGPYVTNPSPGSDGKYLRYNLDGSKIYCVGLYPKGSWTPSGGTVAEATIDGQEDLMFASEKYGNCYSPLSTSPQIFNHELTWVKIRIRTDEHETAQTWGNLKKITITSAATASVTLGDGTINYSGSKELVAFEGDYSMPIGSKELGNLMVSPAPADGEGIGYYNVSVECANHERANLKVSLKDNLGQPFKGDTKGMVMILVLYFKTLKSIEFTATLSNWEDEGRSVELSES